MGPRLKSAEAKIDRAGRHIRDLRQSLRRFGQRDHYDIEIAQYNGPILLPAAYAGGQPARVNHLPVSIFLTPRPEIPAFEVRWGTVIGDVVHNLASALDNLVHELGEINRANWPHNSAAAQRYAGFPYTKDRTRLDRNGVQIDLWQNNVRRYLQLVDPALHPVFEQAQPFYAAANQGINPNFHPMWLLHELWNGDKHQTVSVTSTGSTFNFTNVRIPNLFPGQNNLVSTTIESFPFRPIVGRTEVARVLVQLPAPLAIGAQPMVYVRPNFNLAILFGQGTPAPGQNALDRMVDIRNAVVDFTNQFD